MNGQIEEGGVLLKKEAFVNRQPGIIGADRCRHYSVLIPLLRECKTTSMLFEKRSRNLRRQPGEICFPGGKQEPEETEEECAIREAAEELAIQKEQIRIIGTGDIYISPFNMMIHPFIGEISDYQDTFSTDEVEEIIKVPLDFFRNSPPEVFVGKLINEPAENFPYELIPGGIEYPWTKGTHEVLFYRYHNWTIWGMTAHIAQSAIKLIDEYMVG